MKIYGGIKVAVVIMGISILSVPLFAKSKPQKQALSENQLSEKNDRNLVSYSFPLPESLKPNFEFWKLIYSKYDKNDKVIHDTEHLEVIYSVVDANSASSEKIRIRNILLRLATNDYQEQDLSAEEKRIYHLFDTVNEPEKFKAAAEVGRIRSQTGQKDKFLKAIAYSGAHLTQIEDVFNSYGLPTELTRLPFVESMFNLKARSKVGASGIWQFMPGTAKIYGLKLNAMMDERNDPLQATHAAAHLLKSNYDLLQSWPLAINAYNAGPQNLMRASRELGTQDIGVIAKQYRGGGYKFASRNFYTEFLAALEVANHYKNYFGEMERLSPVKYEEFFVELPLKSGELAEVLGIDLNKLQEMNPGLNPLLFISSKPLPVGYAVRIPHGTLAQVKNNIRNLQHVAVTGP